MTDLNEIFGEVIHTYTTDEAIEDGFLDILDFEELPTQRFKAGQVLITSGMSEEFDNRDGDSLQAYINYINSCLKLHLHGIFGDIEKYDVQSNVDAIKNGGRVLSSFPVKSKGEGNFWIITEADRSSTTLLLPSEY